MLDVGFRVSVFHPCLFFRMLIDWSLFIVGVATDDSLEAYPDTEIGVEALAEFRRGCDAKWPMTHKDSANDMLGVEINMENDGVIIQRQPNEVAKIIHNFFPTSAVPEILTPLHPEMDISNTEVERVGMLMTGSKEQLALQSEYRRLLGVLGM